MYHVIFDDDALSFLAKLPQDLKRRIFEKILSTKENPYRFFERLSGRTDYRLRVGNYRVIADIDDLEERIEVTLIGHRKNVYRN